MQNKKLTVTCGEQADNHALLKAEVSGVIDSYTSRSFQKSVLEMAENEVSVILLDCSGLTYVSSAGIGSFVIVGDKLGSRGGLVLYALPSKVLKVFTMLNMASFFNISENEEEALDRAASLLKKSS